MKKAVSGALAGSETRGLEVRFRAMIKAAHLVLVPRPRRPPRPPSSPPSLLPQ